MLLFSDRQVSSSFFPLFLLFSFIAFFAPDLFVICDWIVSKKKIQIVQIIVALENMNFEDCFWELLMPVS